MSTEPSTAPVIERNLGPQPLDAVLLELQLSNHDLVALHSEGLTHKTMQRARKGRRLTSKMKVRITETLNMYLRKKSDPAERQYRVRDLFTY